MRAFAAAAAAAALTVALVWPTGAEAAEARIESFAFACTTPEGQTQKPKFGDIEGVFYSDIPAQREQCLDAIKRKIALCRQNIDFESNTKNEKHAGCLPIFKRRAEVCIDHFKSERYKCGGAPLDAGEAAEQADEAAPADAYTVDPLDTVMEVARRANVRSGPGTDHAVIGTLDAGVGVRVTGQVEGGAWLRVDLREDGGAAGTLRPRVVHRHQPALPGVEFWQPRQRALHLAGGLRGRQGLGPGAVHHRRRRKCARRHHAGRQASRLRDLDIARRWPLRGRVSGRQS